MNKSASGVNFFAGGTAGGMNDGEEHLNMHDMGEMHIRRRMAAAKERMRSGRGRLEETMRSSRSLMFTGLTTASPGRMDQTIGSGFNPQWLDNGRRKSKAMNFGGHDEPKYVGQQANELSKWMNADHITRHKEESNLGVPTLRQVLKLDDEIGLGQMTKSQLCALPGDPTLSDKGPRRDPNAKQRHVYSYRPIMKD